ncbi:phage holin family protein [Eubacteriaceae bacterium ES2]|nr:phage holin family protein [Eubacteriaceae bacterium ES2]
MKRLLSQFIIILLSIFIMTLFSDSIQVETGLALFVMSLTVFLISLVLKPILLLISLPFNILTFGLFSLFVNAILISISDSIVAGVAIGGFTNALLTSLVILVLNHLLTKRILSDY